MAQPRVPEHVLGHWLAPTVAATSCWALSDVCCDYAIAGADDDAPATPKASSSPPPGSRGAAGPTKLTPEQNAMISAAVAATAGGALCAYRAFVEGRAALHGSPRDRTLAFVAGAVHFCAYAIELRAFRTASSTVITPLLQLSAVWMTLLRSLQPIIAWAVLPAAGAAAAALKQSDARQQDALYVASAAMHPAHLVAIFLIFVGGFLPAARGNVSKFVSLDFYRQEAVACCVFGELLICIYNALLHACTFRTSGADASSVLHFFVVSRAGNATACLLAVALRGADGFGVADLRGLRRVSGAPLAVAISGEVLSVVGVAVVMFSYSSFHEPAVVNAAEGGVQQLLNLLFAVLLRFLCGFGRDVTDVWTKIVSFVLISLGLALSTIS